MTLARLRRRAAWGLRVERGVRALAPAGFVLAIYCVIALFGFGAPWGFAAAALLAIACLIFGIARLRPPAAGEVDRRIERASGLRHRPIAMLQDAPENDSEMAAAIWQIHQRRIAASLQSARAGLPAIGAARHDPFALRGLLLLLLLAGAIIAGPACLPRLAGSFALPAWPFAGPSVDAWITLPAYAGAPPLLLAPGDHPVVLAGSRLTVVVNGQRRRPPAALGTQSIQLDGSAQDGFRADAVLQSSARLCIGPWWHRLAGWNITVIPPAPPTVQMAQPLVADHRLLIAWHAQDRYGIAALTATLAPVGHPGAIAQVLALSLTDPNLKDAGGVAKPEIGDSPYAGLQVTVVLAARNLAGVTGLAGPLTVRLPPPDLQDRTAAALAALRQRLAVQPESRQAAGAALLQLAASPPSAIAAAVALQLGEIARQLAANQLSAEAAQQRLGQLVQQIEQGPDYAPARALAAANRQLEQALRQGIAGKPLDNARLQTLLAAMHAALARHLQALGAAATAPGATTIEPGDLDRMAEQIAADEAAGQTEKAAAELNRLQQILTSLQSARPMSASQARRAMAADQAARALSKLTQGESALLDQTNQGNAAAAGQAQLQGQLAATRQQLGKAGIALPGLDDAAAGMDAAKTALAQQNTGTAATAEAGTIQALQRAQAALAAGQGMRFGEGASQGAGAPDDSEGLSGAPDEGAVPGILPSGGNAAGAIQQQIIRNDGDPALPAAVHQYYRNLLDQDSP